MVALNLATICIYWKWPGPLGKIQPYFVVLSCFLINLSIGTFFAIGNLLPYVVSYVRIHSHPHHLRMNVAAYVYAIQVVGIGSAIMFGSLLEKKVGPRIVLLLGGVLMIIGAATSYYTIKISFWFFVFTFGLVNGLGIGVSYVSPIACAMKWMPKWKGLVSGVVVAGIGLSPLVFNAVQTGFINPTNKHPDLAPYDSDPDEKYFTQEDVLEKVPKFFWILGICYAGILAISSICIAKPYPTEPSPASQQKSKDDEESALINVNKKCDLPPAVVSLSPLQMLKTFNFYLLVIMFTIGITITSFFAPLYKSFGLEKVTNDDHFVTIAGSVGAVFNLLGRIVWAFLVDLTDYKTAIVCQGAYMTVFLPTLYATTMGGKVMLFVWICALFFGIGGYMSMFPSAAVKCYGPRDVSLNYGIMASTALVTGSILAGFISQLLVNTIHWYGTFLVLSCLSCLYFFMGLSYQHKTYNTN